jgi:uncharacterized protein YjiS (DUF1127 family)
MDQVLSRPAARRPHFLAALRWWIERIRAHRQPSREMKHINQLPDHLLRDIGLEGLIAIRNNPRERSH